MRFVAAGVVVVGVVCGAQDVPAPPERTGAAIASTAGDEVRAMFATAGVQPRRLLLLGTFHFKDAGLDTYKPQHSFDALSERRQAEISDLLDRLDRFDADVVCVERKRSVQDQIDEQFAAYLGGTYDLPANEIYQVGFRLAEREGLAGVVTVDAEARWLEPRQDIEAWAEENGQTKRLENPYMAAAFGYMRSVDERIDAWPLIDSLLAMNSEPILRGSHGLYLTGSFSAGNGSEYPGADGFVSAWHNRNLRIFQNILNSTEPGDDVVVVIGAGHVPLLRFMAQCSPEFELVDVFEVLGAE